MTNISLVDDPHVEEGVGSKIFDDEGVTTKVTPLIENGVLKNLYSDSYNAFKENKESSDGYSGRIGIYEVLSATETIKELIIRNATSNRIQEQAQKERMTTMIEDGFVKAAQGLNSIEEVLRVIIE